MRRFACAFEGIEIEITGDKLHASQALLGALDVAATRDHRAGGDDFALVAKQRHETKLRLTRIAACADFQRAVFSLGDAASDQSLKRLNRSRAGFGAALIRTNVRDRPQAKRRFAFFIRGAFDKKARGFGPGNDQRLRMNQIVHKRGQVGAGREQSLHKLRARCPTRGLTFVALRR